MNNKILLYYCKEIGNFGDELSTYVVEKLSKKQPVFAKNTDKFKFVAIGSLLNYDIVHSNSVVWGTGTLTRNAVKIVPKIFPLNRSISSLIRRLMEKKQNIANVLAVRGPLTRKALLAEGIPCPEVYGDPAIVMPRLYKPKANKKSKMGLIFHHSQESLLNDDVLKKIDREGIKLIPIHRVGNEQIEDFIDEVFSCDKVFSTSLHGLIIAQVYGVPAQWLKVEGEQIHSDDSHKFNDYFLGVNLKPQEPYIIKLTLENILKLSELPVSKSVISTTIVDKLLSVFPYLSD